MQAAGAVTTLGCQNCGAELVLEAHLRTVKCPYCDSPTVVDRPPAAGRPSPVFALGFTHARDAALADVRRWLRTRTIFAARGLANAHLDDVRGIYLPAYLYSAAARADYTATIGENYTVTETYTTRDAQGRTVTRTRTVVKTEHYPLRGSYSSYVSDVLVSASRGLPNAELEAVEPFDLRALRRYSPAVVSGWIAEEASRPPDECTKLARGEAVEAVGRALDGFMPGDSHSDLRFRAWLEQESADLVLVPVWVLAARYRPDRPPLRLVVNGQTGKVAGPVPLSWVRITLAIVLVLAAALAIWGAGQ